MEGRVSGRSNNLGVPEVMWWEKFELKKIHYKKYIPCLGINRGSSLFIGISYGADPNI